MRDKTWFVSVVCILAIIPGFVAGAIGVEILSFFNHWHAEPDSDFLYLRALFGIEAPGLVVNYLLYRLIPLGVQGGIAGALAIWITFKVSNKAQLDIAAPVAGALFTGALLMLIVVMVITRGFTPMFWIGLMEGAAQSIGLWIGLLVTAETYKKEQRQLAWLAKSAQ